jgi:hypothetical protein
MIYLKFLFIYSCGTGFELRTLHLLGRSSTTWATLPAFFVLGIFSFFWWDWGLNWGLCTYKTGALPFEPLLLSILLWLFFADGISQIGEPALQVWSPEFKSPSHDKNGKCKWIFSMLESANNLNERYTKKPPVAHVKKKAVLTRGRRPAGRTAHGDSLFQEEFRNTYPVLECHLPFTWQFPPRNLIL